MGALGARSIHFAENRLGEEVCGQVTGVNSPGKFINPLCTYCAARIKCRRFRRRFLLRRDLVFSPPRNFAHTRLASSSCLTLVYELLRGIFQRESGRTTIVSGSRAFSCRAPSRRERLALDDQSVPRMPVIYLSCASCKARLVRYSFDWKSLSKQAHIKRELK